MLLVTAPQIHRLDDLLTGAAGNITDSEAVAGTVSLIYTIAGLGQAGSGQSIMMVRWRLRSGLVENRLPELGRQLDVTQIAAGIVG